MGQIYFFNNRMLTRKSYLFLYALIVFNFVFHFQKKWSFLFYVFFTKFPCSVHPSMYHSNIILGPIVFCSSVIICKKNEFFLLLRCYLFRFLFCNLFHLKNCSTGNLIEISIKVLSSLTFWGLSQ